MSELKLNPEVDIDINVEDLDGEFRRIGPLIYRYHKEMSNIQEDIELTELDLKDTKAILYLKIKKEEPSIKEALCKAKIEVESVVLKLNKEPIRYR